MSDAWWTVTFIDNREEHLFASPRLTDDVLVMAEHYGVTGGVKNETFYPLCSVRKWTREDRMQ